MQWDIIYPTYTPFIVCLPVTESRLKSRLTFLVFPVPVPCHAPCLPLPVTPACHFGHFIRLCYLLVSVGNRCAMDVLPLLLRNLCGLCLSIACSVIIRVPYFPGCYFVVRHHFCKFSAPKFLLPF